MFVMVTAAVPGMARAGTIPRRRRRFFELVQHLVDIPLDKLLDFRNLLVGECVEPAIFVTGGVLFHVDDFLGPLQANGNTCQHR